MWRCQAAIKEDLKILEEDKTIYSLFYQMTHITKDRGALKADDRVDALAMAAAYWLAAVAQDETRAAQDFKDRELERVLKDFVDHVFGQRPKPERWINPGPRRGH
jgi:hypothetical protein